MNGVRFPAGWHLERLCRDHPRRRFRCGQSDVDRWLTERALQHQEKHLSVTKVLLDDANAIAGYYTLAAGQIDFSDLPAELVKRLPRRTLPVVVLAWLGVGSEHQRQGLGGLLLAGALRDCWEAGRSIAFVAVMLDCVDDAAKAFYEHWGFAETPGHPYRLFLGTKQLAAMMGEKG